ncbi:PREDICTED: ribonuclease [Prunus dulcis]|uniref:PREDICTED: ribonuclease n=1 Tax=Prunus dulcis TaxID=3755 RepID=A0A5E4FDN6_PRUDU|nr:PREDICTED: ribonuclease [Prunus dulcis]
MQIMLAWEPPMNGVFKLNVDGSRKGGIGCIGAGGIICDSFGDWMGGFAVNLGIGQTLDAELWGLFFGLKLAAAKGVARLSIEMDSMTAVQLIKQHVPSCLHPCTGVIASCVALMSKFEFVELTHVYRERNAATDCLANWSLNMDLGGCFFYEAPAWISSILIDDLLGAVKPRMIRVG